jgi:hypothetical protein
MHKLVALSALLIPAIAAADPTVIINQPPPAEHRTVIETPQYETIYDAYNAPVFTTGALVFIGSYGASVVVAAGADREERDRGIRSLYIPVAGPWIALNERGDCPLVGSCQQETTKKVLLVMDGIFQAAGVITMVDGMLQPSSHRVVTQTSKVDKKIHVAPAIVSAQGDPGVSVFGRF